MPPVVAAAAITGAIGIFGAVSQNVANKAAQKSNDQQQNAAVQNAQTATKQAQVDLSAAMTPVGGSVGAAPGGPRLGAPLPTATQTVANPMATAQQVMGGPPPGPQQAPPTPQQIAAAQAIAQRFMQPVARSVGGPGQPI